MSCAATARSGLEGTVLSPHDLGIGHAPKPRIGLLGGSFNPAHEGHLHLSREALKRLDLDEVWWLVAPQNPLKSTHGMAKQADRLAAAEAIARDPRIRVLDLESRLGTSFTVDTVTTLKRIFPRTSFVWLMGADNLRQIRYWRRWREIFSALPIAVFARPSYCLNALAELPAQRYARNRLAAAAVRELAGMAPPAWAFLWMKLDPRSATVIRDRRRVHKPRPARNSRRSQRSAKR